MERRGYRSTISKDMKYDYGDDLILKADDGRGNVVQKVCTVVGITSVDNAEQSRAFGQPVGTVLYSIEFGDGSDALVVEERLEPLSTA